MISIIISTVNENHLNAVSKNIEATVGVPYEIITISNHAGLRGLCEAYNLGVSQSKFDILCFMHEDIELKTFDWGKNVIKHFSDDKALGLLGVVGSTYKSSIFSGWAPYGSRKRVDYANLLQAYKFKKAPTNHYYHNPENKTLKEVAVLDGVFLCSRKQIIKKHPFDQETFKRFHCYDIDISLNIGRYYKVAVTYDVLLEHLSEGRFEREWADATMALHKKWRNELPVNKAGFSKSDIIYSEKNSFRNLLPQLIEQGYSLKQLLIILDLSKLWELSRFVYIKLYITAIKKFVFNR